MSQPVILWFRNDLRLADNPALQAALATGQPIVAAFILDTQQDWAPGGASRWWLHHCLASLDASFRVHGTRLVFRRGPAAETVLGLRAETGATAVFTGAGIEPAARRVESGVSERLRAEGVPLHVTRPPLLFSPDAIRTRSGGPFGIYTPFANACLAAGDPPPPVPAPERIPSGTLPRSDRLEDWDLLPRHPDWAGGLRDTWQPGEPSAQTRLAAFRAGALAGYATGRDQPAIDGTSRLSPHLHFGEVSPAQVWHAARPGNDKFVRELLWREFCQHLLWHNPTMPERPLRRVFEAMPWHRDRDALRAWQRGRTGIPFVDAGMRQLWRVGWMHNRARLVVASFLVKHLLVPWQDGQRWFWDTLVDADLGNNAASWQWIAGCGTDAAPYFRVFNPVLQGRKFDPDGDYVRRFVPELAGLEARWIHAPWQAPESARRQAGIALGTTYPRPVVDPAVGRARALAAFATLKPRRPTAS